MTSATVDTTRFPAGAPGAAYPTWLKRELEAQGIKFLPPMDPENLREEPLPVQPCEWHYDPITGHLKVLQSEGARRRGR
jgi:hypothetical protein